MDNWGYEIKKLREQLQMTQKEVADVVGFSRGYLGRIEHGHYRSPQPQWLEGFARAFNMPLNKLKHIVYGLPLDDDEPSKAAGKRKDTPEEILQRLRLATPVSIPVYTDFPFHAGDAVEPQEYVYRARTKAAGKNIEGYIVHGKCMEPKIQPMDIIIVDRQGSMDHGDVIACLVNNELHVGYLRKIADELYLENGSGRIRLENCQVAAPVIEIIRRLK